MLKKNLLALLILNFPVLANSNKLSLSEIDLNKQIIEESFANLDQLQSHLQSLFQILNNGNLDCLFNNNFNIKQEASNWIMHNQNLILSLKKKFVLTQEIQILKYVSDCTCIIITNTDLTLRNKFNNICYLEFPIFKLLDKEIDLDLIKKNNSINSNKLLEISFVINDIGLTKINKIARYIDSINTRYGILSRLSYAPLGLFLGVNAIYFAPKDYFIKNKLISSLKNSIGTSSLYDPKNLNHKEGSGKHNAVGWYDKTVHFIENKEMKAIRNIYGIANVLFLGDYLSLPILKEFRPFVEQIRNKIGNSWTKLKGYKVISNDNKYEYVDITLDDERIIGIEKQMNALKDIVRYVVNPELYDRSNNSLDKGILLTGPTRCGKTYVARALAGSINSLLNKNNSQASFKFLEVKPEQLVWTQDGIKHLFEDAKKHAPCVLFIDELHLLPLQAEQGWMLLAEFLTSMSGLNSERDVSKQVIMLAATNHPELLDHSLLQPGRFGTIIHFDKPNLENRIKYFHMALNRNGVNTLDFDLDLFGRLTQKCSYGDLEKIIKDARFESQTLYKTLNQESIIRHIYRIVFRMTDLSLSNIEKDIICAHYSGQALLNMLFYEDKLEFVSVKDILPKIKESKKKYIDKNISFEKKFGKLYIYNRSESLGSLSSLDIKCKLKLAGIISENLLLGKNSSVFKNMRQEAYDICRKIVLNGIDDNYLSKSMKNELNSKAYELLESMEDAVRILLQGNLDLLRELFYELKDKDILTISQIEKIMAKYNY